MKIHVRGKVKINGGYYFTLFLLPPPCFSINNPVSWDVSDLFYQKIHKGTYYLSDGI